MLTLLRFSLGNKMSCSQCGKPIVLIPSAKERAEKVGGKPSDYTKLFTIHAECLIELRRKELRELLERRYNAASAH